MSARSISDAYPNMWILVPGAELGKMRWYRIADASPHTRCACTRAHGFGAVITRFADWSVSGRAAASSARSMP
jgi:hypothetical protein